MHCGDTKIRNAFRYQGTPYDRNDNTQSSNTFSMFEQDKLTSHIWRDGNLIYFLI